MRLTIEGIEALDAIVRSGSFAAAAGELGKAQSAVSYAVRQLENRLGLTLFDRSGHRAVLTAQGQVVLEEGRQLLVTAHRIEGLAERLRQDWEAELELVVDGFVPQEPIMDALRTLAAEATPTRIQVKVEFLSGVQHRFRKDDADIMLVKDFEARPGLESIPLRPVTAVLVAAASHPLAAQQRITTAELHRYVELSIHDSSDASDTVDPTMFGGSRVFYLSDFMTKRVALRMGLGFGWVPLYMVEGDLAAGELVELPYERSSRYSFTPLLVHRTDRPLGKTGKRFLELLQR